ncbi:MAG: hypothetical protein NTY48_02130 [Candidatus Diapherotrites archaeon]|nr:hypothetical protein [Candidatus Diapherotrites archaeon]
MISVKLEGTDFGARNITIDTGGNRIVAPSRALISTETHYVEKIINSGRVATAVFPPYPHEIYEVVRAENRKKNQFQVSELSNPKVFERKLVGLKQDLRFQKNALKLFHYQKMSPFFEMTRENNILLAKFQADAELKVIKVWDERVNTSPKYFETQIDQFRNKLDEVGLEIMPVLETANPDVDNYEAKWKLLHDMGINKVGTTAESILQNWKNYSIIQKFVEDKDIWVHASGVPRRWASNHTTSEMHILQRFGINTFALEVFRPFLREGAVSVYDRNPKDQKLYDQNTCGGLGLKEGVSLYHGELNCDHVCCNGKTRAEFYTDYAKLELLPVYANVHEAFNSFEEMQMGAKRILDHDFKDYVKEKHYLNEAMNNLDKRFS